jgi:C-terminal processing protease CtpA/Prc
VTPYAIQITVADFVASDGKRLEGVGVTPDELVFPSGADLAGQRDPALAHATTILGFAIRPEAAGELTMREWE